MMETTIDVPNAILFIIDSAGEGIEIPEYVPNQVTAATRTAVSMSTRAYVDGTVTVRLANRLSDTEKHGCNIISKHVIQSPSRRISVVTCENKKLFEIDVPADLAHLTFSVDDAESPSVLCIEAQ